MRRLRFVLLLAGVALVSTGCLLAPPEGPEPLRYRDEVFTEVTTTSEVTYGNAPDHLGNAQSLELDAYRPAGDSLDSRPAIVWVHGGGFSGGDKTSPELVDQATTFAKKGYVSVSIEYRLRPNPCTGSSVPGQCIPAMIDAMHDAQATVRFLRVNHDDYGVDPDRIAIDGTSAGAVTALHVAFNADDPGTSGSPGTSSAVGGAVSLSGAKFVGTADAGEAPSLLFHGTNDGRVPYGLAQNTVDEAHTAGLVSYLVSWDAGHVPYVEHRSEIIDLTTNFLYAVLDLEHTDDVVIGAPRIDLLAGDFYEPSSRDAYAWMRQHSPVHFDEANGLWGVAMYDDVLAIGRDPETFSNAGGTRPDTGPLPWMIDLDGAAHSAHRRLVSRGFTPARVRATEGRIRRLCDELIDQVCEQGECDVVRDLSAPLPLILIGDMLGVPPEDRDDLLRWSDDLLGSLGGTDERIQAAAVAFGEFYEYTQHAIATRREHPSDDLISILVQAEVDGVGLDDHEIVFESLLLLTGGHESTRHTISGGIEQLVRNPDERQKLADDPALIPGAVEEMLRWVTPVKNMNRTVTRDVELRNQTLHEGDKALLLYESANHDESHFPDPDRFDVERSPNDHLAFGFGAHFCLGASLARLEIATMTDRVVHRLPDLAFATDEPLPRFLSSLVELPVTFTPSARVRPA